MENNRAKKRAAPVSADHTCVSCGSKFPTPEALEVHLGSVHHQYGKPAALDDEALHFAPGGTVADSEGGPMPGGKMDRETSRPAKRWETPGEEGNPRKGLRNEGVAPIEFPDLDVESGLSDAQRSGAKPTSSSRKPRKKSSGGA
jgi:hypothetical protein